jgi:DnaJ-class molecular chaperone
MSLPRTDLYAVLEVRQDATEAEIRTAFHRLAFETHPDRHPGDASKEARFKEIVAAYEVLGDREKRRAYDQAERDAAEAAKKAAAEAEARRAAEAARRAAEATANAAAARAMREVAQVPPATASVPIISQRGGATWIDFLAGLAAIGIGILVARNVSERHGSRWDPSVQRRRGSDGRFRRSRRAARRGSRRRRSLAW